jgi:hypothetical protein
LSSSFSGPPIMLTGGKFFGLHRPFLLTVLLTYRFDAVYNRTEAIQNKSVYY